MNKLGLVLGAATLAFAFPQIAVAQNTPFTGGDYVEVTGVTIDDGHFLDYATFLAGYYKTQEEFAIKQGWQTGWELLGNVHKREGEPDLYLVRRYRNIPDGAEGEKRAEKIRAEVKMSDAQMAAQSGDRAKFRHIMGTQLLQVLKPK
ncbi:hypothetical protein GCM10011515_19540 [Tsuneonella deserti]|uniref:Uncharacterized protein n=1 Tax=Tsuneonella deserti TaxID=2035528 RepID=A0ABQ1SAV5_9SPHN|nr:hypothetical protein [Tsuneonella deserti]GGD99776.1 hypothetical protein GCM10011515_19540 [Tsuneonella deserti]